MLAEHVKFKLMTNLSHMDTRNNKDIDNWLIDRRIAKTINEDDIQTNDGNNNNNANNNNNNVTFIIITTIIKTSLSTCKDKSYTIKCDNHQCKKNNKNYGYFNSILCTHINIGDSHALRHTHTHLFIYLFNYLFVEYEDARRRRKKKLLAATKLWIDW